MSEKRSTFVITDWYEKICDKLRSFMKQQIKRARMFFSEAEQGVTDLYSASRWPVVQEYENGKAVPNQAILAKTERALGVKLKGIKVHK